MTNHKKSLERQTTYIPMDEELEDRDSNVIGTMFLICMGIAMGCVLTLAFNGCVRDPMPAVVGLNMIRCSVCHYERTPSLNNAKKYRAHHQKRSLKKVDNAQEQAYLDSVLAGGKP